MLTASEVLNIAGIQTGTRPFKDGDIWVTCPGCGLEQTFWHARKSAAEDPTRITEYTCRDCETIVGAVVHWGLQPQPLPHPMYRLKDYAIDTPVDLYVKVPGTDNAVRFPA